MKSIPLAICLVFFSSLRLMAQQNAPLHFRETRYSIGAIAEENGPVYHNFFFENNGPDTLRIASAIGHCHCTSAAYWPEMIPPKGKGMIRMQYDPKGRPWPFDSGLDVELKDGKGRISLHMDGNTGRKTDVPRFPPAEFIQRFDFNEKAIETGEKAFRKFVEKLLPLLEKHGDVQVAIESSASRVPTRSFPSNEELTQARAAAARAEILGILKEYGVPEGRLQFRPDVTKVQGPEFSKDYNRHPERYASFQYVKVFVY